MVEAGFIDADQARKIGSQPILFHPYRRPGPIAPHFVNYVRDILVERYGTKGLHLGYQVHTSLDARYQRMAERIARAQVRALGKKHHFSNAAVVILQPQNGEILAMVGSIDFNNKKIAGQVNMAIEPRQPGSSIKPVLYAAAFDRGWSPASVIWDTPVSYQLIGNRRYRPTNITKRYYGPLRLRMALSNSLNVPAVKLLDQVGIPAMLETAKKLGIESWRNPPSEYGLSLAVGGYEVSLLELTHAFATIANKGVYTRLRPIRMVEDGAGRVVYRAEPASKTQRAISAVAAYQLASVLSDARARKTMFGRPSALDTSQITAVKTGTTDGWRDNLTVGFTSYLSVGVWTGNSNGKPMQNAIGLYTAAPIWHDIMEAVWADPALVNTLGYLSTTLPKGFTRPAGTKLVPVCDWTPGRFTPSCPRMLEEVFPIETARKPPAGRTRGYCLPAGAKDAPIEAYFMPLPKGTNQAVVAQRWMQQRYRYPSRKMTACNTTPKKRRLVKQPRLLPPRQLVKLPVIKNASAATINAFKKSGD
jgi:membrane peptidoglycan carboxypeptidase